MSKRNTTTGINPSSNIQTVTLTTNLYEITKFSGSTNIYKMTIFDKQDRPLQGISMESLKIFTSKYTQQIKSKVGCSAYEILTSNLISFLNCSSPISEFLIELDKNQAEILEFNFVYFSRKDETPKSYEDFKAFYYSRILRKSLVKKNFSSLANTYFTWDSKIQLPGFKSNIYSSFDVTLCPISKEKVAIQILNRHLIFPEQRLVYYIELAKRNSSKWKGMSFHQYIDELYKNALILLLHRNGTHRITSFEWPKSEDGDLIDSSIDPTNENAPSYRQYYLAKYNQKFDDENTRGMPLVVYQNKRGYIQKFPAFLCTLKGVDIRDEHNQEKILKAISNFSIKPIGDRFGEHNKFASLLSKSFENTNEQEKLSINTKPLEIQGKQLNIDPNLFSFTDMEKGRPIKLDQYSSLRIQNFLKPTSILQEWALILENTSRVSPDDFIRQLEDHCQNLKIPFKRPKVFKSFNLVNTFDQITRENYKAAVYLIGNSQRATDQYQDFKKKCCFTSRGLPCQVIKESTLLHSQPDKKMRILKNILFQIQVKSGGLPWKPVKSFNTGGHIIIGVAAQLHIQKDQRLYWLFADYGNGSYPFYYSHHVECPSEEHPEHLLNFIKKIIDMYREKFRNLPSLLVIYESGVIQKEDPNILKQDFDPLVSRFKKSFKGVKLVLIYATREGKMRFSIKKGGPSNLSNPNAMTIVDKIGLKSACPQFYCIHQSVSPRATAAPTLYNILINDLGGDESMQFLEEFTAVYSCLYFNWQGSVPLPAALMSATKGLKWLTSIYPNSNPPPIANSLTPYLTML